jgi:ABC-2 type transport system ATP-binding protein
MIQVNNVTKSYKDVHALKGVSLHVPQGKVKALLGPNGAGKTTLVRIMTTLLSADSGTVTIAGIDAATQTQELRRNIGLTGQYAAVDEELTGYENLKMFGRLYHLSAKDAEARANELLEDFHLTDAAHRPSKTYSGGMRRRLDLAASLIVRPPVLFLDEPTTGLDPASRQDLWDIIRRLVAEGTTVLLTTQYLEEADQLADSIAVINKGEIIAEGTADELKAQSGGNVLEVTIKEEDHIDTVKQILSKYSSQIELDEERFHFSAPISGGAEVLIDAIRAMDAQQIHIVDVQLRRPTLDDVFIALTGEATHDETETTTK